MKHLATLLVAVACATAAQAAGIGPDTHDFFAPGAIDYRTLVAAPPADDSVSGRADHEMAVLFDAHRTPEQAALAKHFETYTVFTMLTDVLGEPCTAENLPRTAAIFKQAFHEVRPVVDDAKSRWNRPRPYIFNPALKPAVEKPNNASYPSGHAYGSAWIAVLLGAALPEHAADWQKEAQLVCWSRLVGGAHYPTDVVSGEILGEAVGREMLKSPQLQKALAEIRAEILARLQRKAA